MDIINQNKFNIEDVDTGDRILIDVKQPLANHQFELEIVEIKEGFIAAKVIEVKQDLKPAPTYLTPGEIISLKPAHIKKIAGK